MDATASVLTEAVPRVPAGARVLAALKTAAWRWGSVAAFLVLWEAGSRLGLLNEVFFPPFTRVVKTAIRLFGDGVLGGHVRASLMRAVPGFLIAAVLGAPLGLVLGSFFARTRTFLELPLEIMAQINPFLLFHILILFMGVGESPKITIIVWTCLWPVTFSAMHGASGVNPAVVKAGRAFGLGRWELTRRIVAPASAPFIFSGLRMSLGYSMFMLIAAEMMGASSGLGWMVMATQMNFQLDRMYAAVLVIAVLGLLMDAVLRATAGRRLDRALEGRLVGDGS